MASRSRLRSTSRKNTPLSPAKPSTTAVVPGLSNQNKRTTRSSSREIAATQLASQLIESPLATLDEEQSGSYLGEIHHDGNLSSALDASSSGSYDQSLLDTLDRAEMIQNLQDLYDDSISLISMFDKLTAVALQDLCVDLLQPSSRHYKRLRKKASRFLESRDAYSGDRDGNDPEFIRQDLVIRKIFDDPETEQIPDGPWRPDSVLCLANLALQLAKALSPSLDERRDNVRYLFNNFPGPFYGEADEITEDIFGVNIEILTQCYIFEADAENKRIAFDPDRLLHDIFHYEDGNLKGSSDKATHSKIIGRMDIIRRYFRTEKPWIDVAGLQEQFPWPEFVVPMVQWIVDRKQELEDQIGQRGGIQNLVHLLETEQIDRNVPEVDQDARGSKPISKSELAARLDEGHIQARAEERRKRASVRMASEELGHHADTDLPEKRNDTAPSPVRSRHRLATGPLKGQAARLNMERFKHLKAAHAASKSGAPLAPLAVNELDPESEVAQSPPLIVDEEAGGALSDEDPELDADDDAAPQEQAEDYANEEDIVATQHTNIILETLRRQNELSNKENKKRSFLDRQEGAEQVRWNSQLGHDRDDPVSTHSPPKRSRRHAAPDDVDEEAEFETDTRPTKKPRVVLAELIEEPFSAVEEDPDVDADQDVEEDIADQETTPPPSKPLPSRARTDTTRSPRPHSTVSPDRPRRTMPSSTSQPEQPRTQRASSSRPQPRPMTSGNQDLPSSSAPAQSNAARAKASLPSTHRSQSRQTSDSTHSRPYSQPPTSRADEVTRVNQEAKKMTRMANIVKGTKSGGRGRRAWTEEEVERLMELIAIHRTAWREILDADETHPDGPKLTGRTNVNLKDKARNIALDYHKSRLPLPPGFADVSIGNYQIKQLEALGIDYLSDTGRRRRGSEDVDSDEDDIVG